jgi:glutathione S-transferase
MSTPTPLRLFGTITSPYVRRVRVVAHELGLPVTLEPTATEAGQRELIARTPLWKVPIAELAGEGAAPQLVFDSRVIVDELLRRHGHGPFAPLAAADVEARNVITVADGALDALIHNFYLQREGLGPEAAPFLQRQADRAASALAWLDARAEGGWLTPAMQFGLPELAVATGLAWMRFRATYPIERHPRLLEVLARCEARDSFAATRPAA